MTYHDNDVYLQMKDGYSIVSGQYRITDCCVTDGQDPNGCITSEPGKNVHSVGKDGKITFRVGRKASKKVADWFNATVHATNTTFGHTAGELNFAFIGTLTLVLTGGDFRGEQVTCVFRDIVLAQGHAGTSNNWWFGGKRCSRVGIDLVESTDKILRADYALKAYFARGYTSEVGDSKVNYVNVYLKNAVWSPRNIDLSRWMSSLDDARRLDGLIMPGSHDAGMSQADHISGLNIRLAEQIIASTCLTHNRGLYGQLCAGSRYFDIRVDYDHDELVTYHRSGDVGANGQPLKGVLDDIKKFLKENPREIVIVCLSHIRYNSISTKEKIDNFLNEYDAILYQAPKGDAAPVPALTLGQARGRLIVACDYNGEDDTKYINPQKGRFQFNGPDTLTLPDGQFHTGLTVYDRYSNTPDLGKMREDQIQKWNDERKNFGEGALFLLSWTLTPNVTSANDILKLIGGDFSKLMVHTLAEQANRPLGGILEEEIQRLASKPNIVYLDYLDEDICYGVVKHNEGVKIEANPVNKDGADDNPDKKYISDLRIVSGKDFETAFSAIPAGFTLIDKDLNAGAGGDYIYLCYQTNDDARQAMRNMFLTESSGVPNLSARSQSHEGTTAFYKALDTDLNKGAGGRYIYLWYTRDEQAGPPVTKIDVDISPIVMENVNHVRWQNTTSGADCNKGARGQYVYIWKSAPPQTAVSTSYITDIAVVSDKNDQAARAKCPSGYTLLEGDLNKGARGDFIYLCVKKGARDNAVLDIVLTYSDKSRGADTTKTKNAVYTCIPEDLNRGAGGKYIYLWYTKDSKCAEAPLTKLEVVSNSQAISGSAYAKWMDSNDCADCNKGAGGQFIYIRMSR